MSRYSGMCAQVGMSLVLGFAIGAVAQTTPPPPKKPVAAKPAVKPAPAKPAPAAAGHGATPEGGAHPGPSANTPGHAGPSANEPRPGVVPAGAERPMERPLVKGATEQRLADGGRVVRRPDGHVSDIHDAKRGMDIHQGLNGERRVSVERADHSRMVVERGRPGFVERPYSFHGRDFSRRSYYFHGREYDRFYRGYSYRGIGLHVYAPGRYYSVGFYGWAYHPWGRPMVYAWGWGGSPWYGAYGYYFAPYPVYGSASLWLTDYLISSDLEAVYEAGQASGVGMGMGGGDASARMSPEAKQAIADEVQRQIALENVEAQQSAQGQDVDPAGFSIARMLGDGQPHVFVAGSPLDVVNASGGECSLSEGDALQTLPAQDANAPTASLVVLASKGGNECSRGTAVNVGLDDLQEMQNHMRETIDRGMEQMQTNQGKAGFPAAPPSAQVAPTPAAFAAVAPPPDPNDAAAMNQQLKDADQSAQEAAPVAN